MLHFFESAYVKQDCCYASVSLKLIFIARFKVSELISFLSLLNGGVKANGKTSVDLYISAPFPSESWPPLKLRMRIRLRSRHGKFNYYSQDEKVKDLWWCFKSCWELAPGWTLSHRSMFAFFFRSVPDQATSVIGNALIWGINTQIQNLERVLSKVNNNQWG